MKKIGKYLQELCILFFTIAFGFTSILTASMSVEINNESSITKKNSSNSSKLADPSTANNYTNVLGNIENDGGRYAGRVWTDKSVYQTGLDNIDGIQNTSISLKDNEDFLISFSALGSSRILNGEGNPPIDLSIVIDVSSSMGRANNSTSNFSRTVDATNDLLTEIMNANENNRVSITLFDGKAYELASLNHYEKYENGNFITATQQNANNNNDDYDGDRTVMFNYNNNGVKSTNIVKTWYGTQNGVTGSARQTNLQYGITLGYEQLLNVEKNDISVYVNDIQYKRVPALIILSDGESNRAYSGEDWWHPTIDYSVNPDGYGNQDVNGAGTVKSSLIRSMKPLMTAASLKEEVSRHYEQNPYIYTVGLNLTEMRAKIALNPAEYVVSDSSAFTGTDKSIVESVYNTWNTYKENGSVTITGLTRGSNNKGPGYYTFSKPTDGREDITTLNYVNKYYDISDASQLGGLFSNIVDEISSIAFHPVSNVTGTSSELDLTYTDPIGEYMDVKDVKGITLFGSMYKPLPNPEVTTENNVKTTTYKFETTDIKHPSYVKDVRVDISKISIKVIEDENGKVTMKIGIPEGLIPLRLETVTTNNNDVTKYETNANQISSLPIRVFYSVGVKDNIKVDTDGDGILDTIDLSKVSKEYKEKNTNTDGTVNFYSNLYSETSEYGDAKVLFRPSLENRYYYFQKNRIIYSNPNGKEGVISSSKPSEEYTPVTNKDLKDDENYYLVIDYYRPTYDENGNPTGRGEYVNYIVERTGAELINSVTYYNPETGETSNASGEGHVVATSIGGVRLGRLNRFATEKIENTTNTATSSYHPTYTNSIDQEFEVFLGNNGQLRVSGGSVTLSKQVSGNRAEENKNWNFIISLTNEEGEKIIGTFNYVTSNNEVGTITFDSENDGTVSLKSGESLTIYNIPNDTKYSIAEKEANLDGYVTISNNATGLITNNDNSSVEFINTRDVGDLTISKTVTGNGAETEREFNFHITLTDKDNNPIVGQYSYTGAREGLIYFNEAGANITLKSGESLTINNLPKGALYSVIEVEANKNGYTTTAKNNNGVIPDDKAALAEFINDRIVSDLTITKTVTGNGGETDREFTFQVTFDDTDREYTLIGSENTTIKSGDTFTLRHGEEVTIKGLEVNTKYKVIELDANKDGYKTTSTNESGTITTSGSKAAFINNKELGSLSISKSVTGNGAETDREFTFQVTFEDQTKEYNYTGSKNGTITSGDTIKLKDGESITINGLELNSKYAVVELEANKDGYTTTSTNSEGTISKETKSSFTNNREAGNLTISKTITGNGGDKNREFTFQVTFEDSTRTYNYNGSKSGSIKSGETITLKHGESVTIEGITIGTTYKVEELESNQDGYVTTSTNNEGTINTNTSIASFINTREVGFLTIEKNVKGNGGETDREFTFQVTLEDTTKEYNYTGSKFGSIKSGDFIKLKSGESITIEELPLNTKYSVIELEANQDGYTSTSTNSEGIVEKDSKTTFTNERVVGDLTITKTVTGNGGSASREFTFQVMLEDTTRSYEIVGRSETIKSGDEITLRHGETITIKGIEIGTKYSVIEKEANQDGYTTTSTNSEGTITSTTSNVSFTNHREIGTLTITKSVTGNAGDKEKDWNFQIDFENSELIYIYTGSKSGIIKSGDIITLKHGETITINGILKGTTYKVTELEANQDGYTTTSKNESGTITTSDSKVEFINHKDLGSLTISKTVKGNGGETDREFTFQVNLEDKESKFTYTGSKTGTITSGDTIKLKDGEFITISGIELNSSYEVIELEANKDGYTTTSTNSKGTISLENTTSFTNTRVVGELSISKNVLGNGGEKDREFTFIVTLEDTTRTYNYTGSKSGSIKSGDTIALKDGETITIEEIELDTKYSVVELEANEEGYITTSQNENGKIKNTSSNVTFTNTKEVGSLTISKSVKGNGGEKDREFTFQVTLDGTNSSYSYDGAKSGSIKSGDTIALKDGETITIHGIEKGINYSVIELEANENGYTTTSTNNKGTIGTTNINTVFTNTKEVGSLTISKNVTGNAGDKEREWNFTVIFENNTDTYKYTGSKEGTITSGDTIALKDGETITIHGILKGTKYNVTELEANEEGYETTSKNNSGTINTENIESTFTNNKETGSLTISKNVTGNAGDKERNWTFQVNFNNDKSYSYTGSKTGTITSGDKITLKDGESITIKNIDKNTSYSVIEEEANQDGYITTSTNNEGTITNKDIKSVFTNTKNVGSLTISKTVTGNIEDLNKDWHFKVILKDQNGNELTDKYNYSGSKTGTITSGDEVTLKSGEKITITGILTGTTYRVDEIEANQNGYVTTATNKVGTINTANIESSFINNKELGSLIITKTVTGNSGDITKDWHFKVTLTDEEGNELAGSYEYSGSKTGTITSGDEVTLKSGENIVIRGLEASTIYTVTELEANQKGYTTTSKNETGKIVAENNITASFINDKDLPLGNLIISKTVTGIGDKEQDFMFTVVLKDEEGNIENGIFNYDGSKTGTLRSGDVITLKHGENITIHNIKEGTTYSVTELGASELGYTTSVTGGKGTIAGNTNREANFINHIEPPKRGNLTISKTVTGNGGDTSREWTFVVIFGDSKETYNYTGSKSGSITSGDKITLKHGESITIHGIIVDTTYSVVELEANQEGYTTTSTASNGIIKEANQVVSYINNREVGNLTISKTVTGNGGDKDRYFTFQVNFQDSDKVYNYTGSKTGTIKSGDTIKLKDGESVTIEDILKDTEYNVKELEANQDGYVTTSTNSQGKITTQNTNVSFINKREVGSLTISKIVAGNGGDKNRDWTFKFEFSNQDKLYHYTGSKEGAVKSGDTIALKHGETITIKDIEVNSIYAVTELEANQDNYVTTVTNNEGTISTEEILVTFVNTKEVGGLTISKIVTGELGELDRDWTFVITLTDLEGNEITKEYHYTGSKEGTITSGNTITLKHGESITIYDLDGNIMYQVVELEANEDGYETTSTNETGTITVNEVVEANFINHNIEGTGNTNPEGPIENPETGADISSIVWPFAIIHSIIGFIGEAIYLKKKNFI